jgi:DNA-binding transcriptional MerR regulator
VASKGEAEVYRPAEACRIAEVAPYVLRYWETEFSALSEGRDKGTAKLYTARDVRIISRIRELLYDEGFTVAGAKKRLDGEIAEGRFDAGLAPAPPIATQKDAKLPGQKDASRRGAENASLKEAAPSRSESSKPPVIEKPAAEKPKQPAPAVGAPVRAAPAHVPSPAAAHAAPAPRGEASASSKAAEPGFDRKMVLRELKDIVRILGR